MKLTKILLIAYSALSLALFLSPVQAEEQHLYLIFGPADTNSTWIWNGTKPVPGINIPMDYKVYLWTPNGDSDPHNYSLLNEQIVYTPVAAPR